MAPLPFISAQSGPRITVNDWLKDPTRIPVYILSLLNQGFLADAVLRPGGAAPAGVVRFDESTPIYADSAIDTRAEGSEVPIGTVSRGVPNVAYSVDKAIRLLVTEEMRRRDQLDMMTNGITQIVNTMIRTFDDMFIAATLGNANIFSQAASAHWDITTTDIRSDILKAAKQIEGAQDGQGSELGYEADTLIVNRTTKFDLINSTQFNQVYTYGGNLTSENLKYTGKLPNKILQYDVLFSPRVPSGTVILMQRGTCGFICDEVPLRSMPMDEDRNRLSWSSIVQRVSAVGLDQPKAVCKITGVT
jgi:hypothetical protein